MGGKPAEREVGKLDSSGNPGQERLPRCPGLTPPSAAKHLSRYSRGFRRIRKILVASSQPNPGGTVRSSPFLFLFFFLLTGSSCTTENAGPEDSPTISREAFVEAYVQLRVETLRAPREKLPLEERDELLATLGLQDEDLLRFVEVWGRDVQFMRRVWEEVDSILQSMREMPRAPDPRGTQ